MNSVLIEKNTIIFSRTQLIFAIKYIEYPKPVACALIENANCVANENYGIFLDGAITQLDVFYQATIFY